MALFKREPALIVTCADALIVLGVSFGLHIDPGQKAAIDAALTIGAGIVIRSQVTPVP